MKLKPDYILRDIAGEYIVVPVCEEADKVKGIISLSESGAFLWEQLQNEQTEDSLVEALLNEYAIDPDTARSDVRAFLSSVQTIGCLE